MIATQERRNIMNKKKIIITILIAIIVVSITLPIFAAAPVGINEGLVYINIAIIIVSIILIFSILKFIRRKTIRIIIMICLVILTISCGIRIAIEFYGYQSRQNEFDTILENYRQHIQNGERDYPAP